MGTDCPHPPPVLGATLEHYGMTPKQDAMFALHRCRPSSDRPGTMIRTLCLQNNTWSEPPMKCLLTSCDLPPEVEYSTMGRWTTLKVGTKINYTCVAGFVMHGSVDGVIECTENLTWTETPKCVPYAPTYYEGELWDNFGDYERDPMLGLLEQNSFIDAFHLDEKPATTPGAQCPTPPYIPNGMVWYNDLLAGSRAEVRCAPGFIVQGGPATVFCQSNLTWSGFPECVERMCGRPPRVPNAYVVFNSVRVGATAWYQCLSSSHKLVGNRVITCTENGEWSEVPECIKPSQDDSTAVKMSDTPNDSVLHQKPMNLPPLPPLSSVSNDPPSIFCSYPPVVANAMIRFDQSMKGVLTAIYSCEENYKLEGQQRIVCLPDGRWTPAPKCIPNFPDFSDSDETALEPLYEPCLGRAYTLSNESGSFTSPHRHLTQTYFPNDVCYWTVQTTPGKCIRIKSDFVDLSPCSDSDRVTVHDGSSVFSSVIAEFCGNEVSGPLLLPVQSSTNYLTTVFNTNHVNEGKGFKFFYKVVDCIEITTGSTVDEETTEPAADSKTLRHKSKPVVFSFDGVDPPKELPPLVENVEYEAGNDTDFDNETIPLIDLANLPKDMVDKPIVELIAAQQRMKLADKGVRLKMNPSPVGRLKPSYDSEHSETVPYVISDDTDTTQSSEKISTTVASTTTTTVTTTQTSLAVTTTTTTIPVKECIETTLTFENDNGIIEWPNPENVCRWVIKAPEGKRVKLTIDYMKLAGDLSPTVCDVDNLTVSDAQNVVSNPYGVICGQQYNYTLLTNSSDVLVQVKATSNLSDAFVYIAYHFEGKTITDLLFKLTS